MNFAGILTAVAAEVASYMALLQRRDDFLRTDPHRFWLREIIDGELDADRIDYLFRDSAALKWHAPPQVHEMTSAIGGLFVVSGTASVFDSKTLKRVAVPATRLHWPSASQKVIEDLLKLRADLYVDVYEAPAKRALDEMITHALMWVVRDFVGPMSAEDFASVLQTLIHITDDELFHLLYELGISPRLRIPTAVVHDVATGLPFREIWHCGIPRERLGVAKDMVNGVIAPRWERAFGKDARRSQGFVKTLESVFDKKRATSAHSKPAAPVTNGLESELAALIYFLEIKAGHSFAFREGIESMLWRRLLCDAESAPVRSAVSSTLHDVWTRSGWACDTPPAAWSAPDKFDATPLVMVSVPWVPPPTDDDPGLANTKHEDGVLFHEDGRPTELTRDIAKSSRQEYFPISVFLPRVMADNAIVKHRVRDLMDSMFVSLAWLNPSLAEREGYEWWNAKVEPGVREYLRRSGDPVTTDNLRSGG